ncbi:patatin-like phospholipase family protein [Labrenzia sp. VG12]|uniref:patatin-like phospholipase family protein n=1 Tax=Labrenzia sp. VG12 TaxID=2021862 RepID=UPI0018DF5BFA|nr:patatin-like phospholipase family protein [Labrenzia sp. VG12]
MAEESSIQFDEVFSGELKDVVARREAKNLPAGDVEFTTLNPDTNESEQNPSTKRGLIGVSLSGGGIRSAAFCLGVLQALEAKPGIFERIDYLSTVSGGGYLGSSVAVGLSQDDDGAFPFPSRLGRDEDLSVRRLRDFSNYLVAGRFPDVLGGIGAVFIGLIANALLVLPFLLLFAGLTLLLRYDWDFAWLASARELLQSCNIFGLSGDFVVTIYAALLAVGLAVVTIVWSSIGSKDDAQSRVKRRRWAGLILLLPVFVAFLELQPAAVDWYRQISSAEGGAYIWFKDYLTSILAGASALFAAAGSWINKLVKRGEEGSGWTALTSRLTGKALYIVAGFVVPLFLWIVYLNLTVWGLPDTPDIASNVPICADGCTSKPSAVIESGEATHGWWLGTGLGYLAAGLVLIIIGLRVPPNAFTLYFLYRDRLAKGFVGAHFEEDKKKKGFFSFPLTNLNRHRSPVVLINAALNIQSDKKLNQRRRHAEFFTFSRHYCGSRVTGYCKTEALQKKDPNLDIATAMAISGAAASANMGNKTKRPLVFSLAILNIRLGYWLPNPKQIGHAVNSVKLNGLRWFYQEVFGYLNANSAKIYLSDGGHIENLGIYELVRRRCKVIFAVDGEADPSMNFSSFVKLQQYLRIDMGVRIEMNWDKIREATRKYDSEKRYAEAGPHCAIGIIHYSGDEVPDDEKETGILVYIKSSVTGDENDYIYDYKRRNPDFPHQSTGDQFFSEEQFEVYRALGFHAAGGLFDGKGVVQGLKGAGTAVFRDRVKTDLKDCLGFTPTINWA